MKKTCFTFLFALVGLNQITAQVNKLLPDQQRLYLSLASTYYWIARNSDIDLDSCVAYISKLNDIDKQLLTQYSLPNTNAKNKIQSLLVEGKMDFSRNNIGAGDSCFQLAARISTKEENETDEAMAWKSWAMYKPLMAMNPMDRLAYFGKALAIYRKLRDTVNQIDCLTQIGYIQFFVKQEGLSIQSNEEALLLEKEIHFPYTHFNSDMLALGNSVSGKNTEYMNYALASVATVEATNDSANAGFIYKRVADMYLEIIGRGEEASHWVSKALDAFQRIDYKDAVFRMLVSLMTYTNDPVLYNQYINLSDKYLKSSSTLSPTQRENLELVLGYCYYHLHELTLAELHFSEAEKLHMQNGATWQGTFNGFSNYLIAQYCIGTKQFARAEKMLKPVLTSGIIQSLSRGGENYVEHMLFSIDSANGDLKSALAHLSKYQRENDSIYDQHTNRRLEELQIRYETEKKDKDLLQMTNKNQLQLVSINKERQIRNIIIATSLIFLALFYIGYRLKQRSNIKLQKQQNEINSQNNQLQILLTEQKKLVEEKEWLVKEIHHRVKNNLQIIISLLNAQSEFLESPTALNAIQESKERMQAIALIHQKLYQPDHGTMINMSSYIQDMTYNLQSSFTQTNRIHFSLHAEPIELDVSQAVPLGLILNEAITNSIKYAFPKPATGTITVNLHQKPGGFIQLKIQDNGIGFPEGFEIDHQESLGIQLIKLFSEQLEGDLKFQSTKGVEISLLFKQVSKATELIPDPNKTITNGKNTGS